jgi:hypothetical protein
MPEGWLRVWSFKPLGVFEGKHCYTIAFFPDFSSAVDFIANPASFGAEPGNYYLG